MPKEEDAEHFLLALESIGLCRPCWQKMIDLENKPKLAERLLKWCRGEYSDYSGVTKRLEKYFNNETQKEIKEFNIESLQAENKRLEIDFQECYTELLIKKAENKSLKESVKQGQHFYEENKKLKEKIRHWKDVVNECEVEELNKERDLPRLLTEFLDWNDNNNYRSNWDTVLYIEKAKEFLKKREEK